MKKFEFINYFLKRSFKYIYLLTNGDVRAKINFFYFLIFSPIYFFLKHLFQIKHIACTAPFKFVLTTPYGKFLCNGKKADFGVVTPGFEKNIQNIFLQHKNFNVFVDVGAHIGRYSVMMAILNKNGKVIAIEPEPNNIEALKYNIKINNLKNMEVFPFAVGSNEGSIQLFYDKWFSSVASTIQDFQAKRYILVRCKKLDNLLAKIKQIDLIKIDIEGFELEALRGAKNVLERTKVIIFENLYKKNQVKIFLEKNNFKVFDTKEEHYFYAVNMKLK